MNHYASVQWRGGWEDAEADDQAVEEDTSYGGGMGQGGYAGQSYRKFKPKMAGTNMKKSSILKGITGESE